MNKRTYIIAEAGVNHNGSPDLALQLVDAAADAGADAVKFQTFSAEKLVTRSAPKAEYQKAATQGEATQFEMLKKLELSPEMYPDLIERCKRRNIEFLSTPFDVGSLQFLVETGICRIKLSSGDATNARLLLAAARTGLPVIVSTGMADLSDIESALSVLAFGYISTGAPGLAEFRRAYSSDKGQAALREHVTLLHCTTEYPAPLEEVNLRAMCTMRTAFGVPVGYSDHTQGITIPIAAVALGAEVIEKHFTLDRGMEGPDHKASLEPDELCVMVKAVRDTEASLGQSIKAPTVSEAKNRHIARKSLVAAREIAAGEPFSEENITEKRPGSGISPIYLWDVIGMPAKRAYRKDELIER
ncbi:N-acetylneuraminate synthase [Paenibacillus antri]|uniref:N-acetylneuraminate synthase n=1 Tax=Paenibacillus antri TaxID=2582848 RepID=A0A5R9G2J3_9BACL|nr:N-acetylneuraminate synthase [Paenibacillus antri]TLS50577.1 N-acetylneuraminate synthase [Paenibacillus antri]